MKTKEKMIGLCSNCDKVFDPPPKDNNKQCCKGHHILLWEKKDYEEIKETLNFEVIE